MYTRKLFHIWLCDSTDPSQNLVDCGEYIDTIINYVGPFPQTSHVNNIISMYSTAIPEYRDLTPIWWRSSGNFYYQILDIFPLAITKSAVNNTNLTCRLKLIAENGYYALSNTTIGPGAGWGDTGGSNAEVFLLYDNNNVLVGQTASFFGMLRYGLSFTAISNYTGLIPPSGYIEYCVIEIAYGTDIRTIRYQRSITSGMSDWYNAIPQIIEYADPYAGGGISEAGGGDGTFDFSSTDVPIPSLPTVSASDTGFITLYNPSVADLNNLANYMWAGAFDVNNFKKLFADPMDAILGLHIVPFAGQTPTTVSAVLKIGNISTGLNMPKITSQYYSLDCGTITIDPKWGAYLDFSPYSKLTLFLPYIGFVPISPDDCMNGTIRVVYHVDILAGTCTAFVYCESNGGVDGHVLYTFTGSVACQCPVTSGQYTNAISGALAVVGGVAGAVAAGAAGSIGGVVGGLGQAANAAVSMAKPDISRSGNFGGSAGLMGIQYPYLILTVPKMCIPGEQNTFIGYPSFVTVTMEDLTGGGYTEIDVNHLSGMTCTNAEADEILTLLKNGVIF